MRRVIVTVLIAGLTGVGVAAASIPDASGVIHACYDRSTGALRVIDTDLHQVCDQKNEAQLSWNQTGPRGPTGAAGPPGPAGSGSGGDVYTTTVDTASVDGVLTARLDLPAGNFDVTVEAQAALRLRSQGLVLCALDLGSGPLPTFSTWDPRYRTGSSDVRMASMDPVGSDPTLRPLYLQVAGRLTSPGSATLRCSELGSGPDIASIGLVRFVALQVGRVIDEHTTAQVSALGRLRVASQVQGLTAAQNRALHHELRVLHYRPATAKHP